MVFGLVKTIMAYDGHWGATLYFPFFVGTVLSAWHVFSHTSPSMSKHTLFLLLFFVPSLPFSSQLKANLVAHYGSFHMASIIAHSRENHPQFTPLSFLLHCELLECKAVICGISENWLRKTCMIIWSLCFPENLEFGK